LVVPTPDEAPAPPRVAVMAEQMPSGTEAEIEPAVDWLKLAAFAAGSANAGVDDSTVARATSATPQ
jgi:hypothetical protein